MNKTELIAEISSQTGLTKKDSEAALNAFITCVTSSLKAGKRVVLVQFGSWERKLRKKRLGRNPKTKEEIEIPETVVPVFKAGKGLKDAIRDSDT